MKMPSSRWWWDLSTREFAELDLSGIVAILPVGAVEQHGPHLPVRVDAGILARAVELMPENLPVLVLPALPIGKSNEHIAYPGTLSLPFEALAKLWFETGKSAWRAGVRKIVLFNSHGGQIDGTYTKSRILSRVALTVRAIIARRTRNLRAWSDLPPPQPAFWGAAVAFGTTWAPAGIHLTALHEAEP
jgi:creatinine amidohydrolase/Fe(II)-dependent formamide hydrolase-like protein